MDVTQNASASQAAGADLRIGSSAAAETPTDSTSDVTAAAAETATPPKLDPTGHHAALDDLTSPPPAYSGGKYRKRPYQGERDRKPAAPSADLVNSLET